MVKRLAVAATALFLTASPLAYAQTPPSGAQERLNAADLNNLTEARITLIKAALQLTPDQEKYWPAVEDAIRSRAKDRQARVANIVGNIRETTGAASRGERPLEILRDRNPVDFMRRRADALAQRSADLKELADAWQPLYQTLSRDQKRRMGTLAIFVIREGRDALEQRRLQAEDDDDEG
jgi:hypothetical protein